MGENELEMAMKAGTADPAARPRFYEVLLRSQVLVLPASEPEREDGLLRKAQTFRLSSHAIDGIRHLAFYTSPARLPAGACFVELAATDLFGMTEGQHLVLNADGPHSKCFVPSEVRSLMNGSLLRPPRMTLPAGERQLLGMPMYPPGRMAAAVARYLATQPLVDRAYLVQHFVEALHSQPAILIAVFAAFAAPYATDRLVGAISVIAADTMAHRQEVDVVCYAVGDEARRDFARFTPIYRRPTANLFARWLGKVLP